MITTSTPSNANSARGLVASMAPALQTPRSSLVLISMTVRSGAAGEIGPLWLVLIPLWIGVVLLLRRRAQGALLLAGVLALFGLGAGPAAGVSRWSRSALCLSAAEAPASCRP